MRPLASRTLRTFAATGTSVLMLATGVVAAPTANAVTPARGSDDPALARYYAQTLNWGPCADLQCAFVTVPRDYSDLSKGDIDIAVSRVVHSGATYRGALVVNPGGPGASGIDFASSVKNLVSAPVAAAFDIVGFDPRGVGLSSPVHCMNGRQTTRWLRLDGTPDTAAEERLLWRTAGSISPGCLRQPGQITRNVSTIETAQDLDIMRQALGQDKRNWFGFSYGTQLGTTYAELFPDRVGLFVLDGAVDPSLDSMQISKAQSDGFQVAVQRFAADCIKRSDCPTRASSAAVLTAINRLLAQLDTRTMPAGSTRLNQADTTTAIFFTLYSADYWQYLRSALSAAIRRNDGRQLMALANIAADRTGPNTYASNQNSAFYAIACFDAPATPGQAGLRSAARSWARGAAVPEMAKSMSWGNAPCSQWFGHSAVPPAPASSTTTAPMLVVGTRFDPATPYAWAVALSRQLPTSTLLTFEGDGHTAYGSGSDCIDQAIDAYLLTGTPPAAGTVCR